MSNRIVDRAEVELRARVFIGQRDGQTGGQWHIYGTQECKRLFNRVSQRQPTTHETVDRQHSERVSAVLLIRRSSVRARRGPPRICAGQKLRICFRALPNRLGGGPNGTFLAHRVFESVGRRFGPGGAQRCLRRSAAWVRPRDLPEPPLSSGLWHICGTFVAHRDGSTACSMCSSSIPLEPDRVAVTADGAIPENSDAGPEHNRI